MPTRRTAGLSLLVVGLLVGGHLVERSAAMPSLVSRPQSQWPPSPTLLVDRQGTATLPANSYVTLYDVPADKWFVLTGFSFPASSGGLVGGPSHTANFQLGEDDGSSFTVRVNLAAGAWMLDNGYDNSVAAQLTTGIAFDAGSKVRVFNVDPSNKWNLNWSIVGYLVPK
jgi:hypothetical protein